jgi:hypothetical protein
MDNTTDDIDRYDPEDVGLMRRAIDAMKRSVPEVGKKNPGVGAVVVLPSGEVFEAFRALLRDGDHCEQTLLDKGPLAERDLRGSRLYHHDAPLSSVASRRDHGGECGLASGNGAQREGHRREGGARDDARSARRGGHAAEGSRLPRSRPCPRNNRRPACPPRFRCGFRRARYPKIWTSLR